MNFSTLFSPLTCLLLAGSLYAQRVDTPEVTRNATSTSIQWLSQANRTYFLQHSTDMLNWSFLPTISSGNGSQLSMGFQSSSPKLFIRLNWTDIPDDGDPNTADFDSDGLESLEELLASPQTSPLLFDTDGDLLSDGQERALNLNATLADTDGNGTIDSSEDFDGDGLSTLFELTSAIPTNPFAADSDNDGLNDDVEILLSLNPLLNDTNGDGTLDSEEDSDGDGVNNLIEQNSGSDPSNNSDLGTPPSEGLNEVRYEIQAARISTDARHLQISSVDRNRFPFNLPFSYGASSRVHFIPTQYIAAPATIPFLESLAFSTLESESNHWQFLRDDQIIVSGGFHTSNPRSVPLTPFNGIRRSQSINSGYGIAKFRLSRTRPEDTPLQQQFIEISEESPGFTTIEGERQDVTSEAKTFTLTIPAGGTKSTPYTVQAPLKNEVETRVDVFPVDSITINTFIPHNNVEDPRPFNGTLFKGDNRHTGTPPRATWNENGSHRTQQKFQVIANQVVDDNGLLGNAYGVNADGRGNTDRFVNIGETVSFDPATSVNAAGNLTVAALTDTMRGKPLMIDRATAPRTEVWIESTKYLAPRILEVKCRCEAGNPLVGASPAISYSITIVINRDENTYSITGSHDGFPAYEIYINGRRVHHHDPLATGEGLNSLFPPEEKNINLIRKSL